MPAKKGGSQALDVLSAVGVIHGALLPFGDDDRDRILASVSALLGVASSSHSTVRTPVTAVSISQRPTEGQDRPLSLRELMEQKHPVTNPQNIALFAFYRERVEGLTRFGRSDLREYFSRARLKPPANFDRDFSKAVTAGWIHEAGAESYITTKGIESVEAGFQGRSSSKPSKSSKTKTPRRTKGRK